MPRSQRESTFIILLLGALSVITPFAIDMYLPAFPRIAAEFHTATSAISLSLSTYFIGFALGQILYGPLLDRFGRKKPLYFGLVVYILASLGCMQARTIHMLIAFRFLQALGGCAAQVSSIAMVRDFFPAKESAKIFSLLFLIIGVSPLLAPTTGSMLMIWLGWRSIFAVLAGIALAILLLTAFLLPEGHIPDRGISLKPGPIVSNFAHIFRHPQFYTYAFAGAFAFAGLFAYVAGSPLVFIDGFHVTPQAFGGVFATLTMGFIGGNQVNVFLLRKFSSEQIFSRALMFQVLTGTVFFMGTRSGWFGMGATLALFFVFLSCIGLTYPNAAALALAPFSRNTGSASALLGFLQMGTGALVSTGIGFIHGSPASSVIALLAGTACFALLLLTAGKRTIVETIGSTDDDSVAVIH